MDFLLLLSAVQTMMIQTMIQIPTPALKLDKDEGEKIHHRMKELKLTRKNNISIIKTEMLNLMKSRCYNRKKKKEIKVKWCDQNVNCLYIIKQIN